MSTVTRGGTSSAYTARFQQLWARCVREHADDVDWPMFVAWLLALRPTLRPASWRQYRAAVIHFLEAQTFPEVPQMVEMLKQPSAPTALRKVDLAPKTSAMRRKSLPQGDFERLLDHLEHKQGRWDDLTRRWLIHATMTGLRPVEWRTLRVDDVDGDLCLVVQNAKHDDVRAHGVERRLYFELEFGPLREWTSPAIIDTYELPFRSCSNAIGLSWPR